MKKAIKDTTAYIEVDDFSHEAVRFNHLVLRQIPTLQFYDGVRLDPDSYGMRWRKVLRVFSFGQYARIVFRDDCDKVLVFCDGDDYDQEMTWEQALEHLEKFASS